jgi:heme A synthase
MLGIQDPIVALAYLLCLVSTLLCVLYAWRNWNRGEETVGPDDVKWAKEEDEVEKEA